jgi:DMSO/TMAO reductase YedYZ molybdopterin-dependent catalytic subunit
MGQVNKQPQLTPDDAVQREARRLTRRSFTVGAAVAFAGLAGWGWLRTRSREDGIPWPFRRMLSLNEKLSRIYFREDRLSPNFPAGEAEEPRVNGAIGLSDAINEKAWRLRVRGAGTAEVLTLDSIKQLPRVEMITELKCIEGWSTVVWWAGARLADLIAQSPQASRTGRRPNESRTDLFDYVGLTTPDDGYYVGLDMASALHSQTLLCYEMNGQALTAGHGAPLRLVVPLKYGIKNIKCIGAIHFADRRPEDYWAERGYDWYAGH